MPDPRTKPPAPTELLMPLDRRPVRSAAGPPAGFHGCAARARPCGAALRSRRPGRRAPSRLRPPPSRGLRRRVAGRLHRASRTSCHARHGLTRRRGVRGAGRSASVRRAPPRGTPYAGSRPSRAGRDPATGAHHRQPSRLAAIAPNRLRRPFTATAPNQVWLADLTYVRGMPRPKPPSRPGSHRTEQAPGPPQRGAHRLTPCRTGHRRTERAQGSAQTYARPWHAQRRCLRPVRRGR